MKSKRSSLIAFLTQKGGVATYSDLMEAGFHKRTLRSFLHSGKIQKIDRALYKLSDGPASSNPDLVTVSIKAPQAVICLVSALAFHEATDEIPRHVHLAIPRGKHASRIKYPPVHFYRFAPEVWKMGVEEHKIEGHSIRVYNLAKTVADCFKFRNKIGIDLARAALKVAITEKQVSPKEIMRYAKLCRVTKFIKPLLETML